MLPETISPKLLDMTHMFIATYGKNPIKNHDEVRVETFKFVIKNGYVGVCSEGYATPNVTELTKLTDMFSPVHAVTVNKNSETNQWTHPTIAYMPEERILRVRGGSSHPGSGKTLMAMYSPRTRR